MSYTVPIFEDTRPLDVICMGRVAVDLYAEQVYSHLKDAQSFRNILGDVQAILQWGRLDLA